MRLFGSYILQDGRVHIFTNVTILISLLWYTAFKQQSTEWSTKVGMFWDQTVCHCIPTQPPEWATICVSIMIKLHRESMKEWRKSEKLHEVKNGIRSLRSCVVRSACILSRYLVVKKYSGVREFIVREGRSNRRRRVINTSLLSSPLWVSISVNLVLAHNVLLKQLLNFYQCGGFRTLQLLHCQF